MNNIVNVLVKINRTFFSNYIRYTDICHIVYYQCICSDVIMM